MAIESYMNRPIVFKLRKVARYIELYGISRTLAKVRGFVALVKKE